MPSFGDFTKDAKDLLSKNYADKGAWKIESKGKGPEKTFIINPTVASKKPIAMDIEYNAKPFKTKTNVTETGVIKPKLTWEQAPHKSETTVTYDGSKKEGANVDFETNYEFKNSQLLSNIKYTLSKNAVSSDTSFNVGSGVSIGGGIVYKLDGAKTDEKTGKTTPALAWNAGVHYAANGLVAGVTTAALKTWSVGATYPIEIQSKKITAAVNFSSDKSWTVGGEGPCVLCDKAKVRARVNQDLTFGAAWISKLSGGWKVAIAGDITTKGAFSWGTTFTME